MYNGQKPNRDDSLMLRQRLRIKYSSPFPFYCGNFNYDKLQSKRTSVDKLLDISMGLCTTGVDLYGDRDEQINTEKVGVEVVGQGW